MISLIYNNVTIEDELTMKQTVNVFLPMRAGSERIPEKNTKTFSGIKGGLCRIKLEQLVKCDLVSKIFVSTNDKEVLKIYKSLINLFFIKVFRKVNPASTNILA